MLQEGGGALFILLQNRYEAWRQLYAGKTVMLNFHAKGEHQRPTSGAGRPALGANLIGPFPDVQARCSLFQVSCSGIFDQKRRPAGLV